MMRPSAHKSLAMTKPTAPGNKVKTLWRWLTRPPQVYVVYLVGLLVVWMVSFYAGTLNPRKTITPLSPPLSAPIR